MEGTTKNAHEKVLFPIGNNNKNAHEKVLFPIGNNKGKQGKKTNNYLYYSKQIQSNRKKMKKQLYVQVSKITFYRIGATKELPSTTETFMVGSSLFNLQWSGNYNLKEATPETQKHKRN